MIEVIKGATDKPVAADELVSLLLQDPEAEGQLITGYPNLAGQAGDARADAIWLSRTFGPVLFDLVEGQDVGDYESRQDDIFRLFQSRLLANRDLVKNRQLVVQPQIFTFGPILDDTSVGDLENFVGNSGSLIERLGLLVPANLNDETYRRLLSEVQSVSSIRLAGQARTTTAGTRGDKLLNLEKSISTLDSRQHQAVIETVAGVQRIRGLAGSGKSIILALKVAYLHGRHPEWRIGVTFYSRSLKDQFRRLITTFCIKQSNTEPDWERIHIVNAWGGRGGPDRTGMYKIFCDANEVEYLDFRTAKEAYGGADPFGGAVNRALTEAESQKALYDVILVDEAQDFPGSFLRMCYHMLTDERRLVYAYDELQSLSDDGMPEATDLFGLSEDGKPKVTFDDDQYNLGSRRDIVLEKCYRNSRPLLTAAHSIGFGVYRNKRFQNDLGLVQMFDQAQLWGEIGYQTVAGELVPGKDVSLSRSAESSPVFLEQHSDLVDLLQFRRFDTKAEQDLWVANEIAKNIREEELRYNDIMVISPNPFTARRAVGAIRGHLTEREIVNHLAGVDTPADVFFEEDHDSVTFTGIHRAKGNEAGMVYVVNAEDGNDRLQNLAVVRNRLFTAITRSKAWVRVCGVGDEMDLLIEEFERVRSAEFQLRFTYPTDEQRKKLRVIHRELSNHDKRKLDLTADTFEEFIEGYQMGHVFKEDLPPDLWARLKRIVEDGS